MTETTVPEFFQKQYLTEKEFLLYMHCCFPLILSALRILAEYLFIDVDKSTIEALNEVALHQKHMQGLLQQLQVLTTEGSLKMADIDPKVSELTALMHESDDSITSIVTTLKNTNQNPVANYYWLLFIAIYAGAYLLQ